VGESSCYANLLTLKPVVPRSEAAFRHDELAHPAAAESTHRARFSVQQFHRLCDAVPERRLELIGGEVLDVIAKGTRHSVLVNRLTRLITLWLEQQTACSWELRVESPLRLGESDEPEPDLVLVRQRADGYLEAHPGAADAVLVIEVTDSSLRFDLDTKARLYAEAGIIWYWVVDGSQPRLIEVAQGQADAPLLESLQREVETLLALIPAAASA
jgi:Uma2 family endonuclease